MTLNALAISNTKNRKKMAKQMYEHTFSSKKEFFKWLEENEDKIDWDWEVEFAWYWKEKDDEE
jgi:hypothetical protein